MSAGGLKVMDSDMHCIEPADLWERYIDSRYRNRAPRGSAEVVRLALPFLVVDGKAMPALAPGSAQGGSTPADVLGLLEAPVLLSILRRQQRVQDAAERGWPAEAQLDAMDREGVDRTVVFPTSGLFALGLDSIEDDFAAAIARAYNDWLYDYCQADPYRLLGAAMIAPHSVEAAVAEARRAVRELGFRAVFVRPNPVRGRNWHDPYYEPLWSELEGLGVPVGFHEGVGALLPQVGQRFGTNIFMRHVTCHPMEMMLAVVSLCAGGVLERHPALRVAYLEANCGWVPWLLDRMDDHYEIELGIPHDTLPRKPSEYFKQQCFVSMEADEHFAKQVIEVLGDDNLVFSTDWPHPDSKYPDSVGAFLQNPLPPASHRKILWDNCLRLYGLKSE